MRKILRYCLLFLFCHPIYAYHITGIEGDVLKNVEARLLALSTGPTLSPEGLKDQINQAILPYGFFKAKITLLQNS
jgi:hypothetical protein